MVLMSPAYGMAYSNLSCPGLFASLLNSEAGSENFEFTVELRPDNRFIVKNLYLMPKFDQELKKFSGSKFISPFDLTHGYWKLLVHKLFQALQSFIT